MLGVSPPSEIPRHKSEAGSAAMHRYELRNASAIDVGDDVWRMAAAGATAACGARRRSRRRNGIPFACAP